MEELDASMEGLAITGEGRVLALSQDLVWNILDRLPLRSLAIARCVCATWDRIVCSQAPSRPSQPWCFLLAGLRLYNVQDFYRVHNTPCIALAPTCWGYSPGDAEWIKLTPPQPKVPDAAIFTQYVTASGGLIAFQRVDFRAADERQMCDFTVGNPLTGNWRTIPFQYTHQLAQLAVDETTKCYKLVVFLIRRGPQLEPCDVDWKTDTSPVENMVWITHVYNSASQAWTAGASASQSPPTGRRGSCYLDGVVYILQWCDVEKTLLRILAYDIERDEFSVAVDAAPVRYTKTLAAWESEERGLGFSPLKLSIVVQVMVHKDCGRVVFEFLGALSYEEFYTEVEMWCLFKYSASDACWVEDERRQKKIFDFFSEVSPTDMRLHCWGQGGMTYVSPNHSRECAGFLTYDAAHARGTYMSHPGLHTKLVKQFKDTHFLEEVARMENVRSVADDEVPGLFDDYVVYVPDSAGVGSFVRVSAKEYFLLLLATYDYYIGTPSSSRDIGVHHLWTLTRRLNMLDRKQDRSTSLTTSIGSFIPRLDIQP